MEKKSGFLPGTKVSLNTDYGVVLPATDEHDLLGLIRWDTPKQHDIEDWRGLFGSFLQIGGKIIEQNHVFTFINDDGTMKK